MIHKIKTLILSLSTLLALAVPAMIPATATAAETQIHQGLCKGADLDISNSGDPTCKTDTGGSSVSDKIRTIINWISAIIGVVAVIMIIFGGFRYITSGGSEQAVSGAKKTILYALVGLIIVALAQLIVKFVLQNVNAS